MTLPLTRDEADRLDADGQLVLLRAGMIEAGVTSSGVELFDVTLHHPPAEFSRVLHQHNVVASASGRHGRFQSGPIDTGLAAGNDFFVTDDLFCHLLQPLLLVHLDSRSQLELLRLLRHGLLKESHPEFPAKAQYGFGVDLGDA